MRAGLFIVFFLCFCKLTAQQQFNFNLNRANISIINPAHLDFDFYKNAYFGKVSATYLNSWSSVDGAPTTANLRGEFFFNQDGVSSLVGAQITADKAGRFSNNALNLKYAAVFSDRVEERGLAAGLSLNLNQYTFNLNNITIDNYNKLPVSVLGKSYRRTYQPGVGLGLFYYTQLGNNERNYIYSGLSAPVLLSLGLGKNKDLLKPTIHVFNNTGYIFGLYDDYSYIEISSMSKYETSARLFVSDIRLKYNFRGLFNFTAGFNTVKNAMFGFGMKRFMSGDNILLDLNYATSFSVNPDYDRFLGIYHELTVGFAFGG